MADAGGHLWMSQADSDWWAAGRILDAAQPRSYCQAIAKYQQTVEKSIKAIAASLRDRMIISIPIGYKHDVARIASALRRHARPDDPTDVQHHINRLLSQHVLNEIKAIDALVPKLPPPGMLHQRNTEYPFERLSGDWTVPALEGTFTMNEVTRFHELANQVQRRAREIVSALRR